MWSVTLSSQNHGQVSAWGFVMKDKKLKRILSVTVLNVENLK